VSEELGEKLNISKEFIEQRRGKVLFATTLQNVPKVSVFLISNPFVNSVV
jgi:hypothetical protein